MQRTIKSACGLAAAALLAQPAFAQSPLIASMWVPPSHNMYRDLVAPLAADIEKATAGRVKFTFVPKAVVGPAQTFDAVRDGLAHLSFISHGYTPGRFALTKIAELPLLGDTAEANAVAYQRVHDKFFAAADEHKGVRLLAVYSLTPAQIMTSRRAVKSGADLAGLKLRVPGGIANDLVSSLGAVPVVKPAPEIYELLSGGIVDGLLMQHQGYPLFKLQGLIRHVTAVPGGLNNTSFAVIMNRAAYDALSPADRAAIDKLSGEALARRAGQAEDRVNRLGREELAKNNVPVVEGDASLVALVKSKAGTMEQAWIAEAKAKGVDGAKALEELRAQLRALSK